MSKLVVDQIQKSGGSTFTLPIADGTAGQYLKTDGAGTLAFGAGPTLPITGLVAPEGVGIVGRLTTHTDRQNTYSTGEWGSSGPWTTYTANQSHADNNLIQFFNMATGDGMGASGSSETWLGDSDGDRSRIIQFANGNRVGHYRDFFHYDNNTSYAGHSFSIMPIRNTSASSITINLAAYCSDYWSAGYEGSQLFVLAPTSSVAYSAVTAVTGTSLASTSNSTMQNSLTGTYVVPANTTILVCLVSTDNYLTTYRFKDINYFYNLGTTFTNSNIICDMRMLSALQQARFNLSYSGAASTPLASVWNKVATLYGDR